MFDGVSVIFEKKTYFEGYRAISMTSRLVAIVMSYQINIYRLHVILHPGYLYFLDAKYVDYFSVLHMNPSMS